MIVAESSVLPALLAVEEYINGLWQMLDSHGDELRMEGFRRKIKKY